MKILYVAIGLFGFIATAEAQTTPPQTPDKISEQANAIISALQTQRNQASDQAVMAQVALTKAQNDIAKLNKEIDSLKAQQNSKPELQSPKPAPQPPNAPPAK